MNRILKGFDYFYNKKPSKWTPTDTVWLHKWLDMVKPYLPKGEEISEEVIKKLF